MSKCYIDVWIVRVKFELDNAIVKDWFASNIQDIQYSAISDISYNKAQ